MEEEVEEEGCMGRDQKREIMTNKMDDVNN